MDDELAELIEKSNLNPEEEKKLEREFARQYRLITREDRLNKIAKDIVAHFFERGEDGKAMVVSIDKATTMKMYGKVLKEIKNYLDYNKKLLEKLKKEKLKLDWKKSQQRRAGVLVAIREILDLNLPRSYEAQIYERKCDEVYSHIYDRYEGGGESVY